MATAVSSALTLFFFFFLFTLFLFTESVKLRPPSLKSWWLRNPDFRNNIGTWNYSFETHFFTQDLDHFSFREMGGGSGFEERYLLNRESWDGKGPIFFYCGNEGDIVWFAENTGFMWDVAPHFGALLVFAEHRYYGESMPYGSSKLAYANADSLSYLTAEQALADFASLIVDLKKNLSAEASPVVLFGGSYGGMLAAWMRMKYPHIAIGALSSSAPILQFENVVPSRVFYDIVSNNFKRESLSCFDAIKASWAIIESIGQTIEGLKSLSRNFNLCSKLNSSQELIDWLSAAYSYLAMVNYPYPASFMMPLPGHPIKEVCRSVDSLSDGAGVLDSVFAGVSVYYNYTGTVNCFDLQDDPHGLGGWNWQACTEMVMPMSSHPNSSMFYSWDFDYDAYKNDCIRKYSVQPRPKWIITEFGGHDIKRDLKHFGSNIIFSNGLLDPWSGGGVLQNVSESIVSLVTDEGAHHLDLRAKTDFDPDWLKEQRSSEIRLIKGWLLDYYAEKGSTFDM